MTRLLYGAPAADAVKAQTAHIVEELGFSPVLAILRAGEEPDDLAYERSVRKICAKCGVDVYTAVLPGYVPQDALVKAAHKLGQDPGVHGVIVMCPRQYDFGLIGAAIGPDKDVDGMNFAAGSAFAPCTAAAVMAMLDCYGVELPGRKVTVIGRGALVGAPIATLMSDRGCEVSVCHRGTPDPEMLCKNAEILVAAVGRAGFVAGSRLSAGQIVIDVGINVLENGMLCGDVDMAAARDTVDAITPVPGGVGAVTPYILALHTAKAAQKLQKM